MLLLYQLTLSWKNVILVLGFFQLSSVKIGIYLDQVECDFKIDSYFYKEGECHVLDYSIIVPDFFWEFGVLWRLVRTWSYHFSL